MKYCMPAFGTLLAEVGLRTPAKAWEVGGLMGGAGGIATGKSGVLSMAAPVESVVRQMKPYRLPPGTTGFRGTPGFLMPVTVRSRPAVPAGQLAPPLRVTVTSC